jgi:mannosyltransferase OCH1-like enzyme
MLVALFAGLCISATSVFLPASSLAASASGVDDGATLASLRAELQRTREELNVRVAENERLVHHLNYMKADGVGVAFPRIIHQTGPTEKIPDRYAPYVKSWIYNNPHWHYRYWSDEENRDLVKSDFPDFLHTFDGYEHNIQRADAVRYMIMYKYGGVYADLDFESVRPLDQLFARTRLSNRPCSDSNSTTNCSSAGSDPLLGAGVVFGEEPLAHSYLLENRADGHMACNAFLASTAGHPFWKLVIALMQERSTNRGGFGDYSFGGDFSSDPVSSTGPRLLQHAYDVWTKQVRHVIPDVTTTVTETSGEGVGDGGGVGDEGGVGDGVRGGRVAEVEAMLGSVSRAIGRVCMVGPQFLYPKLAMWNKGAIYNDKCFGWQLSIQV